MQVWRTGWCLTELSCVSKLTSNQRDACVLKEITYFLICDSIYTLLMRLEASVWAMEDHSLLWLAVNQSTLINPGSGLCWTVWSRPDRVSLKCVLLCLAAVKAPLNYENQTCGVWSDYKWGSWLSCRWTLVWFIFSVNGHRLSRGQEMSCYWDFNCCCY